MKKIICVFLSLCLAVLIVDVTTFATSIIDIDEFLNQICDMAQTYNFTRFDSNEEKS